MIGGWQLGASVRRTRQFAAMAAGIGWALSLPFMAGAQGGFNGPGRYEITNLKSGKVLDLDRNDQTSVIQFSSRGTDNQAWDIRAAGGGFYSLRNVMNGNAIAWEPATAGPYGPRASTAVPASNGARPTDRATR